MKLYNKKSDKIGNLISGVNLDEYQIVTDDYRLLDKYDSLTELIENWEDYKPAEPIIKDPKIRKAVRAWAEANDYPKTMELYYNAPNFVLRSDISTIEFDKEIEPLQHGDQFTITELCGEEEE